VQPDASGGRENLQLVALRCPSYFSCKQWTERKGAQKVLENKRKRLPWISASPNALYGSSSKDHKRRRARIREDVPLEMPRSCPAMFLEHGCKLSIPRIPCRLP
jgi:hypothetical protein